MAKNIINHIDTYNDHSRSITINGANTNVSDLVRSFMSDDIEDVTPAEEPATEQKTSLYPFVVPEKLNELGTCTMDEFEGKYRKAVKSGANVLAPFLVKYRDLQVLNFGKRNKKDIFEVLKAFFGEDMNFGYPNFAAYY